MNEATLLFVQNHSDEDVRTLAFQVNRYPDVDMPWALDQIRGRQMARFKLPTWASHDRIVYPPHLSMEQCSSEKTARYKAAIAKRLLQTPVEQSLSEHNTTLVDLTGGFGVDFSFLSSLFDSATYVEQQPSLCELARHNFQTLKLGNVRVENGNGIDFLQQMSHSTMIYLDPARRDEHGRKTYSIKDCTPNVTQYIDNLLLKCDYLLLKLSPMLDWHEAVDELKGVIEVHIVSVGGECKEMLLVLSAHSCQPLKLICVNDGQRFCCEARTATESVPLEETVKQKLTAGSLLLEPNASIMKAGCFKELEAAFSLVALSPNSHLFVPRLPNANNCLKKNFPGRVFEIIAVSTFNKKELSRNLANLKQANIAVRNFPMTVNELRKRLKLKDGGDNYLFATTLGKRDHLLIIAKK